MLSVRNGLYHALLLVVCLTVWTGSVLADEASRKAANAKGAEAAKAGQHDEAIKCFTEAAKEAEAAGITDNIYQESLKGLASSFAEQKQYHHAEAVYRKLLDVREKSPSPDELQIAWALNCTARMCAKQKKHYEAITLYLRSLKIREKELGPEHRSTALILNSMGHSYSALRKYDVAESLYTKAANIIAKQSGETDQDVLTILHNLSNVYFRQSKYAEQEQLFRRTLAIQEAKFGKDSLPVAEELKRLGTVLSLAKKHDEKLQVRLRQLSILEKQLGEDDLEVGRAVLDLARHYDLYANDGERAEPFYLRALAIMEKKLGAEHDDTLRVMRDLEWVYFNQRKYEKSCEIYEQMEKIVEAKYGKDHPKVIDVGYTLSLKYAVMGRHAEAEVRQRRALELTEREKGKDDPEVIQIAGSLASTLRGLGKLEEARLLYSRIFESHLENPETKPYEILIACDGLVSCCIAEKRPVDAEQVLWRVINHFESREGENERYVIRLLADVARVSIGQQKYREAEDLVRRILNRMERQMGQPPEHLAYAYERLALLCELNGNSADAASFEQRYRALREKPKKLDKTQQEMSLSSFERSLKRARDRDAAGQWPDAEVAYHGAIIQIETHHTCDDPRLEGLYRKLANAVRKQGREREAAIYDQRADRVADVNKSKE